MQGNVAQARATFTESVTTSSSPFALVSGVAREDDCAKEIVSDDRRGVRHSLAVAASFSDERRSASR
jgi:hypothetical protein